MRWLEACDRNQMKTGFQPRFYYCIYYIPQARVTASGPTLPLRVFKNGPGLDTGQRAATRNSNSAAVEFAWRPSLEEHLVSPAVHNDAAVAARAPDMFPLRLTLRARPTYLKRPM